jgi:hypothetical protein
MEGVPLLCTPPGLFQKPQRVSDLSKATEIGHNRARAQILLASKAQALC